MKASSSLLLAFTAVASAGSLAFTETLCLTVLGTSSISPVPSYTTGSSITLTVTTKSTSSKTSTVTPSPVSKTTTVTSTKVSTVTASKNPKTFSSTTTVYSTILSTETETISGVVTTTETSTSVGTTTVGTSAGFTPLQSQIAAGGDNPSKRNLLAVEGYPVLAPRQPAAKTYLKPGLYPSKVQCTTKVQVITTTTSVVSGSKTATITLKPSTALVTSTSYVSSTTTVTQSKASTTVVSTITSFLTSTTTYTAYSYSTVTETTTVVGPSATSYAICNIPGNYLHQVNGVNPGFEAPERDPPYFYNRELTTQESCCNGCAALGSRCAAGLFSGDTGCYFIAQDAAATTCDAGMSAAFFQLGQVTTPSGSAIFNTNCGRWRYDRQ